MSINLDCDKQVEDEEPKDTDVEEDLEDLNF